MNLESEVRGLARIAGACAVVALASTTALAASMQIEAVITPKADAKLEFVDGSKRYLLAAQREGKATGTGPLAGATVQEWGLHEVDPAVGADANGYLVFSTADGDTAYVKYSFRAIPLPADGGKRRFVANGFWELAGATGKLRNSSGAGTLTVNPAERRWVLDGEVVTADK